MRCPLQKEGDGGDNVQIGQRMRLAEHPDTPGADRGADLFADQLSICQPSCLFQQPHSTRPRDGLGAAAHL
jgi:hypothetical protein